MRQRLTDEARNFLHASRASGKHQDKARSREFIDSHERVVHLFLLAEVERIFLGIERMEERDAREAGLREDPQLRLAGEGFAELFARGFRERLPVGTDQNVRRIPIEEMTLTQMRQSAALLRRRAVAKADKAKASDESRAQWLDRTADQMSPYVPQRGQKLTYAEYLELLASGTPARKPERKAMLAHA